MPSTSSSAAAYSRCSHGTTAKTMKMWSVLFFFASIPLTWEIGEELNCPEVFTDGINNITCKINTTTVNKAGCLSEPKTVHFDLLENSTPITNCSAAYDSSNNCSGRQNNEQCWCDQKEGEIFVYKFSFPFNRRIRGQLECKLCPKSQDKITSCKTFKDEVSSASGGHVIMRTQLTVAGIALFSIFFI